MWLMWWWLTKPWTSNPNSIPVLSNLLINLRQPWKWQKRWKMKLLGWHPGAHFNLEFPTYVQRWYPWCWYPRNADQSSKMTCPKDWSITYGECQKSIKNFDLQIGQDQRHKWSCTSWPNWIKSRRRLYSSNWSRLQIVEPSNLVQDEQLNNENVMDVSDDMRQRFMAFSDLILFFVVFTLLKRMFDNYDRMGIWKYQHNRDVGEQVGNEFNDIYIYIYIFSYIYTCIYIYTLQTIPYDLANVYQENIASNWQIHFTENNTNNSNPRSNVYVHVGPSHDQSNPPMIMFQFQSISNFQVAS